MKEEHLLKTAVELAQELDKAVDEHLPQKLAGIVKLHAKLAVGSAFIPIPGADIAAAAANTWTMYVRINKELQLPFGENAVKSLATGVVTNIGTNAAGVLIVASVFKIIPGLGSLGGAALMAATVYALTIAAGIVYMKALAKLLRRKSAHQVSETDLKNAAEEILKDKATIQEIVKNAKEGYGENGGTQHAKDADLAAPTSSPTVQSVPTETTHPPMRPEAAWHPSALSSTAFLLTGGKTYGPYPLDDIRRFLAGGKLAEDTHYWKEGMAGWVPIAYFPPEAPD